MDDDDEKTKRVVPPPLNDIEDITPSDYIIEKTETLSNYFEGKDYVKMNNEINYIISQYNAVYAYIEQFSPEVQYIDRNLFRETAINNMIHIETQIKEMFAIYPHICNKTEYEYLNSKIEDFLKDINVTINYADVLIKYSVGGNNNLTKAVNPVSIKMNLEKILDKHDLRDDAIIKLDTALNLMELKCNGFDSSEEYLFLFDLLEHLEQPKTQVEVKKVNKKTDSITEMLNFIKDNQNYDVQTINYKEMEKYTILSSHLMLKKECENCFHDNYSQDINDIMLKVTEDVLKGKEVDYKKLIKLFEKNKVPFLSSEKLIKSKASINEKLTNLNAACYLQSNNYKRENSWKFKLKLLVATVSLVSLGVIGYTYDAHVKTPEYVKNQTEMTTKLYEDKKDAIKKMENDVLKSISNRNVTIDNKMNNVKDTFNRIGDKVKKKKRDLKDKKDKIMEIIRN